MSRATTSVVLVLATYYLLEFPKFSLCASSGHASLALDLLPYWKALGWKNVTIVSDGDDIGIEIVKAASAAMVEASIGKVPDAITPIEGALTIVGESQESFDFLKRMLTLGRPAHSCLIAGYDNQESSFEEEFGQFNKSTGFFRTLKENHENGSTRFYRVQTFRDQDLVVQNEWKLNPESGGFEEEVFDLQGAFLTSITKTWQPWLTVHDCEIDNRNCETSGILHEIMELLAQKFNFTLVTATTESWGTVPVSGSYLSPDAVWAGVLGGVVNDEYDMSVSVWTRTFERDQYIADFTDSLHSRHVSAVLNTKQPPVDITLFLRPFTVPSWLVLIAASCFISVAALVPFWIFRRAVRADSASRRIAAISGWGFFLLVNAYYAGALTMFFTSPESIPFETIRQGMTLYPDWKMVVNKGSELHILKHENDPLYSRYWEIMQEEEDLGLIQPTMKDALRKLLEPGHFLINGSPLFVIQNFLEMNEPGLDLRFLRKEGVTSSSIVVSDNSPVVKMLNKGISTLRQSGTLDTIIKKGSAQLPGSSGSDNLDRKVLGGRHLGLVFFFYAAAGFATLPVLVLEKLTKRLADAVVVPMYRRMTGSKQNLF